MTKHSTIQVLKRAISRLTKAEVEYAWRGAGHPEDIPAIEQERINARSDVQRILECLEVTLNEKPR